jgi:hypothetical protein
MNGPEKDSGRVHDGMREDDGRQDERRGRDGSLTSSMGRRRVYLPVQERKAAGKAPRSPSVQRREADTSVLQNLMAFNSVRLGAPPHASHSLVCMPDTQRVQLDTLLAALELYKENAETVATAAQVMCGDVWILET